MAERDHVVVDPPANVKVELHAGQVLEAQVAIAIDRGAIEPGAQIAGVSGIRRQQIDERREPDLAQRFDNRQPIGRLQALLRRIQVQPQQTVAVTTLLRQGSSSALDRTVNKGVSAVRKALGF